MFLEKQRGLRSNGRRHGMQNAVYRGSPESEVLDLECATQRRFTVELRPGLKKHSEGTTGTGIVRQIVKLQRDGGDLFRGGAEKNFIVLGRRDRGETLYSHCSSLVQLTF